jgi:hypothetical protein
VVPRVVRLSDFLAHGEELRCFGELVFYDAIDLVKTPSIASKLQRDFGTMGLTVSKCEKFVAEAPAGDGLYFVVGRGRAYWSYQFRRGTSWSAKGLGGYPEFSPKDARDRLKHWQVTGSLPGESPRTRPRTTNEAAEVGVPFTEALSQWLKIASQGWRSPRTAAQARSALTKLRLWAEPVDRINTEMVLRDLLPLPARQRQDVRMWLATLLDFAKGQKWRTWDPDEGNPAKFENERRGMWPKFKKSENHHAAFRQVTPGP